jgi:hypothetical protein
MKSVLVAPAVRGYYSDLYAGLLVVLNKQQPIGIRNDTPLRTDLPDRSLISSIEFSNKLIEAAYTPDRAGDL